MVDSLAKEDSVRPAAEATWAIGTRILQQIAWAGIVIGIPVVFAAWLAGPRKAGGRAAALDGADDARPAGLAWSVFAVIVLLVLAWGPIPATRMPVTILHHHRAVGLGVRGAAAPVHPRVPRRAGGPDDGADARARQRRDARAAARPSELERLARLHDQGVLTDEEFAAQKSALLGP